MRNLGLLKLGWTFDNKIRKTALPPGIEKLLVDREGFKNLLESGQVKESTMPIEIPEFV
jgi:hypothetical protein